MSLVEAEGCAAWLDSLAGQVGTFYYQPRQSIQSYLTGRVLAAAGAPYQSAISVAGWGAGTASGLRQGQYLSIGDQLLRIVAAPANADGSGRCTIEIQPSLRLTYTINTSVNFISPKGKFRLATSDGFGFMLDPDRLPEFPSIPAVEAVE